MNVQHLLTPVDVQWSTPIALGSSSEAGYQLGQGQHIIFAQTRTTAETSADLFGNISGAFSGFYESGQMWALLIGVILGYMVRSLTAY